jgi:hypothetical protein
MYTDKGDLRQSQHIIENPKRSVEFIAKDQTGRLHHCFQARSQYSETRFTNGMEDLLGVPFHSCHVPESGTFWIKPLMQI